MNNFWNNLSNFTLISLITFKVLNQTSSNLQRTCRDASQWCLRKEMVNSLELTSELTSKWITFRNTESSFTLISLLTLKYLIKLCQTYRELAVKPVDGACKITWKTVENWRLNWRLNEKLLKYSINLRQINSEVAVIPGDGACKNYMENGSELTSELTSKWITFKVLNQISHESH